MKGKKRYRKGKGIRKRKELIVICDVTQEIRKQLNRLRGNFWKTAFELNSLHIKIKILIKILHLLLIMTINKSHFL